MLTLVRVRARLPVTLFLPAVLAAQCRVPEIAPDALSRLSPAELLDAGHYRAALRSLEPAAQANPQSGRIAWMLSRARAAVGDLDEALDLADRALATDDSIPEYHVQAAAVSGRLAEKAGLFKQLSFARRAKKELDAAAALDPSNTDAQWGLMMFFYAAPGFLGGDKEKTRAIGQHIVEFAPAAGLYYQARLAEKLKDTTTAENLLLRSAMADPTSFDTSAELAAFYMNAKPDQAKAEKWACQTVHTEPDRAHGWALLAKTYAMCGCWTEAGNIARFSEAIDPDDLAPWYAIAAVAIEKGEQIESAEQWLRKYLARPTEGAEPSWASAHWQLGLALSAQRRRADAITELKIAVEQDPSNEKARADLKRISSEKD